MFEKNYHCRTTINWSGVYSPNTKHLLCARLCARLWRIRCTSWHLYHQGFWFRVKWTKIRWDLLKRLFLTDKNRPQFFRAWHDTRVQLQGLLGETAWEKKKKKDPKDLCSPVCSPLTKQMTESPWDSVYSSIKWGEQFVGQTVVKMKWVDRHWCTW